LRYLIKEGLKFPLFCEAIIAISVGTKNLPQNLVPAEEFYRQ